MASKKVLFITSTFARNAKELGTVNPWMQSLISGLKTKGINISVMAPAYQGSPSHRCLGIDVFRFRYAPSFWEILSHDEGAVFKIRQNPVLTLLVPFYLFSGCLYLALHLRDHRYDIIHIHWPLPNGIFGLVAKWVTDAKIVLTFYGAEFTLVKRFPVTKLFLRAIIKSADRVLAISSYTSHQIKKICPVPVRVIPFSIGAHLEGNQSGKTSKRKGDFRILFVGRLISRKGVSYLIKAMPLTIKKIKARLDIVGGGMLFDQLVALVKKLELQNNVFIHGRVSQTRLNKLYQECDVFVLPAIKDQWGDTEGLGVVLLEAMVFEKAVIASKVGGIVDIVKDGVNGLLVPQKNSRRLSEAIIRLAQNPQLRRKMGKNALALVRENFSWETIIQKTLKAYNFNHEKKSG